MRDGLNRQMTMDESVDHYRKTGQHLGKFNTPEEADAYAERMHREGQIGPYREEVLQGDELAYSDERTKREVDGMDNQDIQDWADRATELPVTYRYKPGIGDGGKDPQLGVLAQDLEKTGPLGKINVHKDEDGVRSVSYGPAAFMLAKAGFDRATEARDIALALQYAADGRPTEREDTSEFGPALALAASRAERRKEVR